MVDRVIWSDEVELDNTKGNSWTVKGLLNFVVSVSQRDLELPDQRAYRVTVEVLNEADEND